jgi:hypothetical protein
MDVLIARKDGTLEEVGIVDTDDMICESTDDLLLALFDEARNPGVPVVVEQGQPNSGYELVKLTSDPESVAAFRQFLEAHNYRVRDVEAA